MCTISGRLLYKQKYLVLEISRKLGLDSYRSAEEMAVDALRANTNLKERYMHGKVKWAQARWV
jgi:hypothetical protein